MKKFLSLLLVGLILLISCRKNGNQTDPNELQIVSRSVNGSLYSIDSLIITQKASVYIFETDLAKIKHSVTTQTPASDWTALTELLDLDKFKSVNLNSCNACIDGSDGIITIKMGNYFHSIRFGYGDSIALKPIDAFVNKLMKIHLRYSDQAR